MRRFTALIEYDPETAQYAGIVPGIPGAHTQAATLDELRVNLKEVLELCLEEMGEAANDRHQGAQSSQSRSHGTG